MPSSTLEDNRSSCSGTTLGSKDTEPRGSILSELDSDYIPSETSDDGAFIGSDTEELACDSDRMSDSRDSVMSLLDDYLLDKDVSYLSIFKNGNER